MYNLKTLFIIIIIIIIYVYSYLYLYIYKVRIEGFLFFLIKLHTLKYL